MVYEVTPLMQLVMIYITAAAVRRNVWLWLTYRIGGMKLHVHEESVFVSRSEPSVKNSQ
jgi:hypothetical protein